MPNKLKDFRQEKKWSQEKLSKESGVSRNTISSIENGTNVNVTRDVMEKLAKALDKKVTTIFFE